MVLAEGGVGRAGMEKVVVVVDGKNGRLCFWLRQRSV